MAVGGTTRNCLPLRAKEWTWKRPGRGTDGGTNILCDNYQSSFRRIVVLTPCKVKLVRLSMKQKDALTVLLTGRSENRFGPLIKRMVDSKKLEFDMICLKPEVAPNGAVLPSTMEFKKALLKDLVFTYAQADAISVYEDRPGQSVIPIFFPSPLPPLSPGANDSPQCKIVPSVL